MSALNRSAAEAMDGLEVHAATDVTGYGLLGHAHEMMEASGATAEIHVDEIPFLSLGRGSSRLAGSLPTDRASTSAICGRGRESRRTSPRRTFFSCATHRPRAAFSCPCRRPMRKPTRSAAGSRERPGRA